MKILNNIYPNGKKGVITMSYDDGNIADRRLIEIFNKHGIKGTFHLNSGRTGASSISLEEIATLYKGHEVSSHTLTHPAPDQCSDTLLINEIMEDRANLEKACGYVVRGMSYPYGNFNDHAIDIFRNCGMRYSRTTISTNGFGLPYDFMKWNPTCHHKGDLKGLYNVFNERLQKGNFCCFYIWGHSYEFNNDNNWNVIEEFCDYASGNENVWYATNIEIYDYITACRNLFISTDGTMIYNPSGISVWVTADGTPVEIKPGDNKLK